MSKEDFEGHYDIYEKKLLIEKKIKINMEEVFVFPHVRYVTSDDNPNPHYVYKKYIGNHESLTNGKVYQFHKALFSPNIETPRKKVWIAQTDIGLYVRYEDTINQWANVRKPK